MAQYRATGNISHNGKRHLKGALVELDPKEKKSDRFVLESVKADKTEKAPSFSKVDETPAERPNRATRAERETKGG